MRNRTSIKHPRARFQPPFSTCFLLAASLGKKGVKNAEASALSLNYHFVLVFFSCSLLRFQQHPFRYRVSRFWWVDKKWSKLGVHFWILCSCVQLLRWHGFILNPCTRNGCFSGQLIKVRFYVNECWWTQLWNARYVSEPFFTQKLRHAFQEATTLWPSEKHNW